MTWVLPRAGKHPQAGPGRHRAGSRQTGETAHALYAFLLNVTSLKFRPLDRRTLVPSKEITDIRNLAWDGQGRSVMKSSAIILSMAVVVALASPLPAVAAAPNEADAKALLK